MVGYHRERWPLPAFAALPGRQDRVLSARTCPRRYRRNRPALPPSERARISAQLIEASGAVAEALRWRAHPVEHRQE